MKNNDLLLFAGVGVLAYLFLKPKAGTPAPVYYQPSQTPVTYNPTPAPVDNTTNTAITTAGDLLVSIFGNDASVAGLNDTDDFD